MSGQTHSASRPDASTRIVQVRQNVLKHNDLMARALRAKFHDAGVYVVSLVSSPGAGKTAFLEKLLELLRRREARVAALVGDLATDNDAQRLAKSGAPVRQITTGTVCHLEAQMVEEALADWRLKELDFLLVENVGNLVCPASYDLGEDLRAVLLSVTEGEDKPLKYPGIFNTADVAIISKMDLAVAAGCDVRALRENIERVRPGMNVLEVSARKGIGMERFADLLAQRRSAARQHPLS